MDEPTLRQALRGLLAEPEVRAALWQLDDRRGFVEHLCAEAPRRGIAVSAAEIASLLQAGRRWPLEVGPAPNLAQFRDWLPAAVTWHGQQPLLHWAYAPSFPLQASFYAQTVHRVMAHPFNRLGGRSAWLNEIDASDSAAMARPAAFIFHWSRCGSTLLGRMLNAHPGCQLYAEPEVVESVLHADIRHGVEQSRRMQALRRLVATLCVPRTGSERHTFIKFDSWSVLELALIREVFPEVPAIFLYRDPIEVLVSHERSPGMHMLPAALPPAMFGLDLAQVVEMPLQVYRTTVLHTIGSAALQHARAGALQLVNYHQLPAELFRLCRRWNVAVDDDAAHLMQRAATMDSKSPGITFHPDGEQKRRQASPALQSLAGETLYPLYDELERLRRQQPAQ
jgi:hypothetical protein